MADQEVTSSGATKLDAIWSDFGALVSEIEARLSREPEDKPATWDSAVVAEMAALVLLSRWPA